MRDATFQSRMSLLALCATLLLVIVPSLGRVLPAALPPADDGLWTQMCTLAGLKLVKLAPDAADPLPSAPIPGPAGDAMAGGHCDYCPLANALIALVLWIALVVPRLPTRLLDAWQPLRPARFLHPSGLGSRGPPIAL